MYVETRKTCAMVPNIAAESCSMTRKMYPVNVCDFIVVCCCCCSCCFMNDACGLISVPLPKDTKDNFHMVTWRYHDLG